VKTWEARTPTRRLVALGNGSDIPPLHDGPEVVIAHDFMETFGGAERVTAEMAKVFPHAPVFAILGRPWVAREMGVEGRFQSLLPPRTRLLRHYRLLTPGFAPLTDRLRLPPADVLLTSSYAFAHRLRTSNDAPQVCYCHSPLRFAWTMQDDYRAEWTRSRAGEATFDTLAAALRRSDQRSSGRVDRYLTQAEYTAGQIRRFYGRRADVIGAPVDCERFHPSGSPPSDYFLLCGRLIEPYLGAAAVIEAFKRLPDRRLVIVGVGPHEGRLRANAPANVEFRGRVDDGELVHLMQHCLAGLSPSRHDFGLIPIEFQACGRPVLALAEGGALSTVAPGISGEFFAGRTPEAIASALEAFDPASYDSRRIRDHALQWDSRAFRERIRAAVLAVAGGHPVREAHEARELVAA
jgi:glycosyltransferase involved in cell wall biosynthesis